MSETDTPIMPAPDRLYASGNSIARYRKAFTTLHVFNLVAGGHRLEINDDGKVITFDLSAEQSSFLARLLDLVPERIGNPRGNENRTGDEQFAAGIRYDFADGSISIEDYRHDSHRILHSTALEHEAQVALTEALDKAGGVLALATKIGLSHQAVGQWNICPPRRVLQVEAASGVSRHRLRPDLYPSEVAV